MLRSAILRIRQGEARPVLWRWPLPFWITVSYLVAMLTALLMVTTWREDDLMNPDATSILLAGIIGGLLALWLAIRNIQAALIDAETTSKQRQDDLTVSRLLALEESRTRPLWIVWLMALATIILIDALALVAGKPASNLPIGLDRIDSAAWETWFLALILFAGVRPITEELIFRGILYPALARWLDNNLLAALATAALFTIFYLLQVLNADLGWTTIYWGFIYPLTLGLTASLARAHTKSTWAAVGSHVMFGLFLVLSAMVTFA
ncbi:MAG: CPBP family intramembrane metalloprotease [Chloroflexi bacterium]|nr:CPBP family intramembrane metalloprotease [Chloroflexota bacterium]